MNIERSCLQCANLGQDCWCYKREFTPDPEDAIDCEYFEEYVYDSSYNEEDE
jgi:hypothetical protein